MQYHSLKQFARVLFFLGIFLLPGTRGLSQIEPADTVTRAQLEAFKQKAEDMYYDLENEFLKILTPGISERDLRIAVKGAKKLFSRNAQIKDKFESGTKEKQYDGYRYFETLRHQLDSFYSISKRWELKSNPGFIDTKLTSIVTDSSGRDIPYRLYKTQFRFVETCIVTHKETKEGSSKIKRHYNQEFKQTKALDVHLRKFPNSQWGILFYGISIIPDTLTKEPGVVSVIPDTIKQWLDSIAIKPGEARSIASVKIPEIQPAGVRDTTPVIIAPPITMVYQDYQPARLHHYLTLGLGHLHIGNTKQRSISYLYFIPATLAFGVSVYFKIESDALYKEHLEATTLQKLDEKYAKANRANHRFLGTLGLGALIWLGSDLHLFFKDKKQRRLEEEKKLTLSPYFLPLDRGYVGITSKISF